MDITSVTVPVDDLDEARRFYATVLGLPTAADGSEVRVSVGSSQLRLRSAGAGAGTSATGRAAGPGCEHLAFTIPTGSFERAGRWLRQRVPLLMKGEQEEFEGPPSWDSRSLYFPGPSGAVLELIERRRLPAPEASEGFSGSDLQCISEVGVAVTDLPHAIRALARAGLGPAYGAAPVADFAPVGDDRGLLILVSPGRAWLPTDDRTSRTAPLRIAVSGSRDDVVDLDGATVVVTA